MPNEASSSPPLKDTAVQKDQQSRNVITVKQTNMVSQNSMGKSYAILFATSDYSDPKFSPLPNPSNDAESLKRILEENYGFDVTVLKNPGRGTIALELKKFSKRQIGPNDQLLIFLAGHGDYDPELKMPYLVLRDSSSTNESRESFIAASELIDMIDRLDCKHILVWLDCCASGAFDKAVATASKGTSRAAYPKLTRSELQNKSAPFKTRKMVTATTSTESTSDGIPGGNSPLTSTLISLLKRAYVERDGFANLGIVMNNIQTLAPGPKLFAFGSDESPSDFFFIPLLKPTNNKNATKTVVDNENRAAYLKQLDAIPDYSRKRLITKQLEEVRGIVHRAVNHFCFDHLDGFSNSVHGGLITFRPDQCVLTADLTNKLFNSLQVTIAFTITLLDDEVVIFGEVENENFELQRSNIDSVNERELDAQLIKFLDPIFQKKIDSYRSAK